MTARLQLAHIGLGVLSAAETVLAATQLACEARLMQQESQAGGPGRAAQLADDAGLLVGGQLFEEGLQQLQAVAAFLQQVQQGPAGTQPLRQEQEAQEVWEVVALVVWEPGHVQMSLMPMQAEGLQVGSLEANHQQGLVTPADWRS